jgi:bifunctional non-homologous end joining protein LigD
LQNGLPAPRLNPASACASQSKPPAGDGWLHEPKHDGHRLIVVVAGNGTLRLLSRNGTDRTALFRVPFDHLAAVSLPIVLDGEIAVPDERGVTHIESTERCNIAPQTRRARLLRLRPV